jgi:uncharacterized DUF497 family protein
MRIEFDKAKDRRNRAKHSLSLGFAARLDWDSMLVQVDDREDMEKSAGLVWRRKKGDSTRSSSQ